MFELLKENKDEFRELFKDERAKREAAEKAREEERTAHQKESQELIDDLSVAYNKIFDLKDENATLQLSLTQLKTALPGREDKKPLPETPSFQPVQRGRFIPKSVRHLEFDDQ